MNSEYWSSVKGFTGIVIMLFSSIFQILCALDLFVGTTLFPNVTEEGLKSASHILLGFFVLGWVMILSYRMDRLERGRKD